MDDTDKPGSISKSRCRSYLTFRHSSYYFGCLPGLQHIQTLGNLLRDKTVMCIRNIFIIILVSTIFLSPCFLFGQETKEGAKTKSVLKETAINESKSSNDSTSVRVKSDKIISKTKTQQTTQHEKKKTEDKVLIKFIKILNEYSSLLSAVAALLAALIALYLGDWKSRIEKPRLKLTFEETKTYPFFQTIAYENFGIQLDINGVLTDILRPGFNARVMIENKGKRTAKRVEAKIEKIEFYKGSKKISATRYYHPTTIKWSGEKDWSPVDIVPKSHFFLDLFWAKNEQRSEIMSFNIKRYHINGIELNEDLLEEIICKDIRTTQEIYWNVWVDNSYNRGLPRKYDIEGEIHIYIVVNADNCAPVAFEAIVDWTYDSWNKPNIKIRC